MPAVVVADARQRNRLGLHLTLLAVGLLCLSQLSSAQINVNVYGSELVPLCYREDGERKGAEVDVWDAVVDAIEANGTAVDYTWVWVDSPASAVAAAAADPAGVALCGVVVSASLEDALDVSFSYADYSLGVVAVTTRAQASGWLFVQPFTVTVWLLTAVLLYVSGHIVWFFEAPFQPAIFSRHYFKGVNEGIWYCWGILTSSNQYDLIGLGARMYAAGWALVCLTLIAAYTASLTAILTSNNVDHSIDNPHSMGGTSLAVLNGTEGQAYVKTFVPNAFMYVYNDLETALEAAAAADVNAVVHTLPMLQYALKENPELRSQESENAGWLTLLSDTLENHRLAMGTTKGTIDDEIDAAILELSGNEKLYEIMESWFYYDPVTDSEDTKIGLTLVSITFPLVLLAVGLVCGGITYLLARYGKYCIC